MMKPADAYRLKYHGAQTIEPSNTAGVDSLPDELLARILSPVDLKSLVQARAVCKSWKASVEGKAVSDLRATMDNEPLIALIGGSESEGGGSEIMNLRIGRGAWFAGPPMPEFRRGHCVVAVGHKIYVVGGVKSRRQRRGQDHDRRRPAAIVRADLSPTRPEARRATNPRDARRRR